VKLIEGDRVVVGMEVVREITEEEEEVEAKKKKELGKNWLHGTLLKYSENDDSYTVVLDDGTEHKQIGELSMRLYTIREGVKVLIVSDDSTSGAGQYSKATIQKITEKEKEKEGAVDEEGEEENHQDMGEESWEVLYDSGETGQVSRATIKFPWEIEELEKEIKDEEEIEEEEEEEEETLDRQSERTQSDQREQELAIESQSSVMDRENNRTGTFQSSSSDVRASCKEGDRVLAKQVANLTTLTSQTGYLRCGTVEKIDTKSGKKSYYVAFDNKVLSKPCDEVTLLTFRTGDRVQGRLVDSGGWYLAKIERVKDQTTYDLVFDHHDTETDVSIDRIRPIEYSEGDRVQALHDVKGRWLVSKIVKLPTKADEGYQITFDGEDNLANIYYEKKASVSRSKHFIRPIEYCVGDRVIAEMDKNKYFAGLFYLCLSIHLSSLLIFIPNKNDSTFSTPFPFVSTSLPLPPSLTLAFSVHSRGYSRSRR